MLKQFYTLKPFLPQLLCLVWSRLFIFFLKESNYSWPILTAWILKFRLVLCSVELWWIFVLIFVKFYWILINSVDSFFIWWLREPVLHLFQSTYASDKSSVTLTSSSILTTLICWMFGAFKPRSIGPVFPRVFPLLIFLPAFYLWLYSQG